uniref:Coiled-coil domain containing 155 n=1 Tax=Rousettus aegyptiacus TaxID=9407 RepID=A0A7J8CEK4_ROUAE|nr:hypothetical protein HJG63_002223 [Rousettus aegyptiacus]
MDLPESLAGSPATKMYLWDQAEEGSLGTLLNSEEQILNSMFEACDPQRTGFVAVTHILAYLEAMTGRSPQDTRLQTLAHSLDPNGEGPQATVDLHTFLVIMRDWIAACQLDGGLELEEETAFEGALTPQHLPSGCPEESANLESFGGEDPRPELPATADLLSSLEDLELSNRRLAGENAKLQRSVETAEEGSARLGEEITALRKQLRSTQQALQFAKAVDEELEDLKSLAKSLEEQNRSLLAQARQTEKEQQHLVAEIETLLTVWPGYPKGLRQEEWTGPSCRPHHWAWRSRPFGRNKKWQLPISPALSVGCGGGRKPSRKVMRKLSFYLNPQLRDRETSRESQGTLKKEGRSNRCGCPEERTRRKRRPRSWLNSPSLWETLTPETSQEVLLRAALPALTHSEPWCLWRRSWSQSGGRAGASSACAPCTPSSSGSLSTR